MNNHINFMKAKQQGQILLIIILLSTVILTVVLSVSQISTQEQRIAKLEEDSKKAFAAAEAGLEAGLKLAPGSTFDTKGQLFSTVSDIATGSTATVLKKQGAAHYLNLAKDESFTFYLADYDRANNTFSAYYNTNLYFYFENEQNQSAVCPSTQVPILELLLMTNDPTTPVVKRKLIDPCSALGGITGDKITAISGSHPSIQPYNESSTGFDKDFTYKTSDFLATGASYKFMIIRALFTQSGQKVRLVVERDGSTDDTVNPLPAQGQTVESKASTTTGVTKKLQLFQSHPQIPADLFITSF